MSDRIASVVERPQHPTERLPSLEAIRPVPRQQDKIIAIISRGDQRIINQPQVQLLPDEKENFLSNIAQGRIGDTDFAKVVSSIRADPLRDLDPQNPTILSKYITDDKQRRGIVAHFVKGDLQNRNSLTSHDIYTFATQRLPNAWDYEKETLAFLDRIEQANGQAKRREYEEKVADLGKTLYGKQWEYLQQVHLLQEEAMDRTRIFPIAPALREAAQYHGQGIEQAQRFNNEHRLSERIQDGYKDGGRRTSFDEQGNPVHPTREVIVVDRKRDVQLQRMIVQTKEIKDKYGNGLRAAFEIAKLVHERMHSPRSVEIVAKQYDRSRGKEVLLGDISVDNGSAGVCRHRSLLFQTLATEIGIDSSLVRGNVAFGESDIPGGHAWNELQLYGHRYIIDIMNPPGGSHFRDVDYTTFMRQGGFPETGSHSFDYRYMDVYGKELYRT